MIHPCDRNTYIDFLRALGLILLIGVHVNAPEWYKVFRSFDVPLMVFVSALCYKPKNGYFEYIKRRFLRIYIPVSIFLTIFFFVSYVIFFVFGKPKVEIYDIIGSYLLLNSPSIGYVWIMRVFIMISTVLPMLYRWFKNIGFWVTNIFLFGLIVLQYFISITVDMIDNKTLHFILDETILYITGFCPLIILGLKIKEFNFRDIIVLILLLAFAMMAFISNHDMVFSPQNYKYPPSAIYILYGLFGCCILWLVKPILSPIATGKLLSYFSKNSMWIYLWHIMPVYVISQFLGKTPNMWFARYCIVLFSATGLYLAFKKITSYLPTNIFNALKKYL